MKKDKIDEKAIDAVAAYLRSEGWVVQVGGFTGIEQGTLKYNYRLIFEFTGKPNTKAKIKSNGI